MRTLALALGLSLFAMGCDDDDDEDDTSPTGDTDETDTGETDETDTGEPAEDGMIRVVHLSPDAGPVNIWVNETIEAFSGLSFEEGTAYAEVPAGDYSVQVTDPTVNDPSAPLFAVEDVPVLAGTDYTAIAYGYTDPENVTNGNGFGIGYEVDLVDGIPADNVRARLGHFAADVGEVDLWDVTDPENPALLWEDVNFTDTTTIDLPFGEYTICFDVDNDMACDLTFSVPDFGGLLPPGITPYANVFAFNDSDGNVAIFAQIADLLDEGIVLPPDAD